MLLTFILVIPPILRDAEELIVKGIAWTTFLHVLVLLLPQALSLTIPMSVLLGILIGFGRLSADREFVAHAGVRRQPVPPDPPRGARRRAGDRGHGPPDHCRTARRRIRRSAKSPSTSIANRAESNVKPRVFYGEFPNRTIYVRDVVAGRLARRVPGRHLAAGADDGVLREGRPPAASIARSSSVALELTRRDAAHDVGHRSPTSTRAATTSSIDHPPRSGDGLSQHHAVEDGDAR